MSKRNPKQHKATGAIALLKAIALCFVVLAAAYLLPLDEINAYFDAKVAGEDIYISKEDEAFHYYYRQLSEKEKKAYLYIYSQIEEFPEYIRTPVMTDEELDHVFQALLYDNPEFYFLDVTCNCETVESLLGPAAYKFIPLYRCDKAQYESMQAQVEQAADAILAGMPSGTDYEKELYIHDTLIELCDYGSQDYEADPTVLTIYGALVRHQPICEGYARAAQYLLEKAGIPSYLVIGRAHSSSLDGNTREETHMWNVVTIDGLNYNLDLTWDDLTNIKNQETISKDPSHMYFNLSTDEIRATHNAANPADIASCTNTLASYYKQNALYFESYGTVTEREMIRAMARAMEAGRNSVEFKFSASDVMDAAKGALLDSQQIYDLLEAANQMVAPEDRVSSTTVRYALDPSFHVMAFYFSK